MKQFNLTTKSVKSLFLLLALLLGGTSPTWADTLTEGFESVEVYKDGVSAGNNYGNGLSNGWVVVGGNIYQSNGSANYGLWTTAHSGSKSLEASYGATNSASVVITTKLSGTFTFWARKTSTSSGTAGYLKLYKANENEGTYSVTSNEIATTVSSLTTTWTQYTADLGDDGVYVAINLIRAAIDDISATIYEEGAIAKPTGFEATSTTYNSATFSWTAGGTETAWQIAYGATGFDKASATPIDITENPYTLTGLSESTTYDAYLRAKSGEDVSSWTGKVTFTTPAQYPAPTAFAAGDYTATSQTFSWTNGSTETAWELKYDTNENFDPASEGTSVAVTSNPYTLEGLTAETTYYAYLRANYGTGYSAWSEKISFKPSNTKQTTINDGTTTNTYIPVYGNWVDNVNYNKSQFVIPSTSLTAVNGRDISKLTFYTNSSSAIAWTSNVFDIYMKEVNVTTVSTSLDRTGTKVFTGSLSVAADGKMEITLGESFPYEGGNLQISFDMTTKGSYSSTSFYGVTGESNCSMYTSNSTGTSSSFLPKITIESVPSAAVAVKKPKSLEATSVLATKATLSWTDGEDGLTAWEIKYDTDTDFDPNTEGTLAEANANPFTVTGLTAETTYYAYARAKKGGDTSDWSDKISFTTPNAKPSDVVIAPSDNSAKFSWTANAGETAWQIVYSTDADFDKAAATPIAVTTNPYTLTGLAPETTYYAYLRADLGGGNYSDWTAKQTFTTGFEHELTVNEGNGTSTSGAVPFSGYDTDNADKGYGQFIIPASQLGTMNGGKVNKITFYATSNINWSGNNTPTFKVYLKEVDNEKFASKEFIDWATMTEIYDGEIVFDGKELTINLATPHNYTGKNLMIGFKQTTAGGYCTTSWVGASADNEVAVQNASGATNYNWGAFLPKTTFNYETLTGPRLAVSTDALDFGEITQASTASDKQKTFTISNTGVAELTGLSVAVSGTGYSVSALPRTNITTSGDNATPIELTVTLAPTTSGSYDGTVTVSATGQPDKVINLTATYVADPIMGVFTDDQASEAATTGQTVNFGYVESAPTYTYYIKNTGAGTLDVAVDNGGLTVAPANASIAAGEQQAFTITANVANADATVTFAGTNHDGGAEVGTFAVTLQGTVMPLTTTFFEGFNYADGDATDTELVGWEINNNDANVKFYNGFVYYWASSTESGSIVTPKLHVSGASDVLNLSAYARNLNYSNTKLAIAYSADKTNWTELTSKGKSNLTTSAVNYEFSGIPEGNWYIKVEMSDVAVGYFYGFSTTLTPTTAISETTEPTLTAGVQDVELTYTKAAEKWGTLALPFATTTAELGTLYGTTVKAYAFTAYDSETNGMTFESVTTLEAGKPYVIYSEGAMSGAKLFTNKNITATSAGDVTFGTVKFQSTYAPIAAGEMTGKWGVTPAGKIAKAGTGAYINGFRAYFDGFTSAPSLSFEDTTTGITIVKQADELDMDGKAYNLNGQRVNSATKGLYIVNGRKVVIK